MRIGHHPEHKSYNAMKMIPKQVLQEYKDNYGVRKFLKKIHNKRSRQFRNKNYE